jgi:hypothetical protein
MTPGDNKATKWLFLSEVTGGMSEKRNHWAVLCRNEQHGSGGYPIPLVEVDPDYKPTILDSFVIECPECKEESVYTAFTAPRMASNTP